MDNKILKKYLKEFYSEMFKEVDNIFPERKKKERANALLLITVLGVKFQNIISRLIDETNSNDKVSSKKRNSNS